MCNLSTGCSGKPDNRSAVVWWPVQWGSTVQLVLGSCTVICPGGEPSTERTVVACVSGNTRWQSARLPSASVYHAFAAGRTVTFQVTLLILIN